MLPGWLAIGVTVMIHRQVAVTVGRRRLATGQTVRVEPKPHARLERQQMPLRRRVSIVRLQVQAHEVPMRLSIRDLARALHQVPWRLVDARGPDNLLISRKLGL